MLDYSKIKQKDERKGTHTKKLGKKNVNPNMVYLNPNISVISLNLKCKFH